MAMKPGFPSTRRVIQLAGICLIVAASARSGQIAALLSGGLRVQGVVETSGPGGRHPVIRYAGPEGHQYWLVAGGVFAPLQTGEHVDLIYNPSDPLGTARLDTVLSLWSAVMLPMGLGMALILVPIGRNMTTGKPEESRQA
jgi:hypothetical protein